MMSKNDEPIVVIEHLTKRYGGFVAVDDLNLTLERGRILGFIGPNGAGKTTTIKVLVGHARPTSGFARINGVDCTREPGKIKKLVGYMPDRFGAYDNMRVREYLDFFGAAFGIPRKVRRKRIEEVMETAGITHMKDLFVESLSHGMQQRVGITRTLLHDPDLLILDEPANGLDPRARIEIRELLLHLAELGKTLIVTSHILPELSRICDEVAIISQGKLRASGTLEQILRQVHQRRIWEVMLTNAEQLPALEHKLRESLESDAEVDVSPAEATVRCQTVADDEKIQRVLHQLVVDQFPVVQFREIQLDLEETFMTVTKGDQAETTQKVETKSETRSAVT
ncbi:MAG: ABC transporter ATP-binding protein [Planctomycetaceae bacterium]|nr:ABC transporter ATP-binding protein [Planctomycetaceae bacterium]